MKTGSYANAGASSLQFSSARCRFSVRMRTQSRAFLARSINVIRLIGDLVERVALLNLPSGIENSLNSKLDTAFNAIEDAIVTNDVAAVNSLDAFINSVQAQGVRKSAQSRASC